MKAIKKIKEYLLLTEIGRGSFGIVYEALSETTNKLYAIKALSSENFKNPRVLDQLKNELKILFSLNHQNIIKIIGVEKTINNIYLILEYCNGGTLLDYVTWYKKTHNKNIPEEIIQKILKQIIEGLKYMHKSNIIHRDIKLENILINFDDHEIEFKHNNNNITNKKIEENNNKENHNNISNNNNKNNKLNSNDSFNNIIKDNTNYFQSLNDFINSRYEHNILQKTYSSRSLLDSKFTIKIADLGYARILHQYESSSTICGTPLFMAPDIVNLLDKCQNNKDIEFSNYNSSIDIWSLGIVFYELLIGNPPFTATYKNEIFKKILAGVYKIPKNLKLSVEALSFLTGVMEFYPEKRFKIEELNTQPFIEKNVSEFVFLKTEFLLEKNDSLEIMQKNLNYNDNTTTNNNAFVFIDCKETSNLLIRIINYFKIDIPSASIDNKKILNEIINENILSEKSKYDINAKINLEVPEKKDFIYGKDENEYNAKINVRRILNIRNNTKYLILLI